MTLKRQDDRPRTVEEDPKETGRDQLLEHIERLERKLDNMRIQTERAVRVLLRLGKVFAPFGILLTMLFVIFVLYPSLFNEALTRMGSGLLLGKLSAIGGQGNFLFWLVVLGTVDVVVGLFLVWNLDLVHAIPRIGPGFRRFEARGAAFLGDHGWVRRLAFIGIVLVVIVPFQGTGAVMGSILGRLIGIGPWRTFAAIVIGAYTGVALVLSGSAAVTGLGQVSPWVGAALALAIVLGAVWVWRRWFRERDEDNDQQVSKE